MVYKFIDAPLFWFIVTGFATWRIASIVHHEGIASPFRRLLGVKELTETDWTYPDTFIGKLIECFYCTSVWIGITTSIVMFLFPLILTPFALSAIAIIIENKVQN